MSNFFHPLNGFFHQMVRGRVPIQFTFAASAATIVGGGLVTNRYKMRLPAAFICAFVLGVSSHGGPI